jgi:hypothetical protein
MVACAFAANEAPRTKNQELASVVFRPEAGKFPPIEKAHTYRGQAAPGQATRSGLHHAAKAKAVIQIFCPGGLSHVDS